MQTTNTPSWAKTLHLDYPVVQAGMGGGVANAALASAVSLAGGLGTLATEAPRSFRDSLAQIRQSVGSRPFAANLLMSFVRRAHITACLEQKPNVVVLFLGYDSSLVSKLKAAGIQVWQQVGDLAQAKRALATGVDGLIAQGVEAGGHLASDQPLDGLIPAIRQQLDINSDFPLLAAGGIYNAATAHKALQQGANGVVAGTRFLLTPESGAHEVYKQRLIRAKQTVRTQLFGLTWPAWHRVAVNQATERWLKHSAKAPIITQLINSASAVFRRQIPIDSGPLLTRLQSRHLPFYAPIPLAVGMKPAVIDTTPLYASQCVGDMYSIMTVKDIVKELAGAWDE